VASLFKSVLFKSLLGAPLRALVISLVGAALAWAWFDGYWLLAAIGVALLAILGIASQGIGDRFLPENPKRAVAWLNWIALAQTAIAAAGAAAVIIATVALTAPKDASTETQKLLAALSTGVTTFITAALVTRTNPDDDIGSYIQGRFFAHYKVKGDKPSGERTWWFPNDDTGKEAQLLVYSSSHRGITGWGREDREKRARLLADELKKLPRDIS
jgi:hypothetical protein